eukprot:gene23705-28726_t
MLTESEDHDGHDHDHSHESSVSQTPASGISAEEFMNLTRFGETMHLRHVLDKSPGLVDARGCTPLCICAQYNHTPLVVFLLHIHADSGVCDSAQDTPAHWAAYKGHAEVLEVLCACASALTFPRMLQASTAKKDKGGLTPLDHAVQKGHAQLESVWLWRVIFVSNFYATYMTLYYMIPYVYNTIGRDNYKYFFTLLCTHPMAYGAFVWCTWRARLGEVFFPDTRLFFSRDEAEAAARASGTSSTSSTV